MDEIKKMLRLVINNQSAFKQDVLSRLDQLEKRLDKKIDGTRKDLTERMDKIGKQLAYLEDDAPTREEFDKPSSI